MKEKILKNIFFKQRRKTITMNDLLAIWNKAQFEVYHPNETYSYETKEEHDKETILTILGYYTRGWLIWKQSAQVLAQRK